MCLNFLQISNRFFRVPVEIWRALQPSIISNYSIIIINAYYKYCIINAQYNYYISNEFLTEECDQEENVEVTRGTTTSCLKRSVKRFVQCHVFAQSPPGRRPNDKYPVNASHGCKNVSLAVLFDCKIN